MNTSLSLKTIRRSNKNKKERYDITNVSLKDIYKIVKEFEDLPYGGYMRKRSKHVRTESYSYLAWQLDTCMLRSNMRVVPIRAQMINTQNMNNYETSTQKYLI